jgi:anti-sigma factor RsiW
MTDDPRHDEIRALLGAYALDAVDPEETRAVEDHLRECPQCRAEVEQHRSVAALLGNVGAAAPAGLWDRIAASLDEQERQPGSITAPLTWDATAPPNGSNRPVHLATPGGSAGGPTVVAFPADGRRGATRRRGPAALVAAVAAACVLLVAAVGVLTFRHQQQRVDDLAAQVAAGRDQRSAGEALADPDSTVVRLSSGDGQLVMRAVVTEEGTGYLLGGNLPDAGAGATYQLWGLADRQAVSLGVLGPTPGIVAFQVEDPMTALAITSEAQGGADQPTSAPLVSGALRPRAADTTSTS